MTGNKPHVLTTSRYKRNLIITGAAITALIVACVVAFVSFLPSGDVGDAPDAIQALMPPTEEDQTQEVIDTINTPEHARNFIAEYYRALAGKDAVKLRSIGATQAANAADRGWLNALDYKVDLTKVETPDAQAFPSPQGLYAGCTLYKISDFFSGNTADAIWNNATGLTSAEGWIYYDPINVKWVVADPTIPTAFSAPASTKIERTSANGDIKVTMEDTGVYSSPWWAWSEAQISIDNKSTSVDAVVSPADYDSGFTLMIPEKIKAGVRHAGADGGDSFVSDRCVMYRGVLSGFGIEKIGAKPLAVDGNICPIVVACGDENIAPIFAVGKTDSAELADEIAQTQIDDYGATNNVENVQTTSE